MGHGAQAAQDHGQQGCPVHPGMHDRNGRGLFHRCFCRSRTKPRKAWTWGGWKAKRAGKCVEYPLGRYGIRQKIQPRKYFKAKGLETHLADEVNLNVKESFDERSMVFTDKSTSYVDIADYIEMHVTEKSTKESTKETLRWVYIFISNAQHNLLGNYHKIKVKYLQSYLNEFVYKVNRRYFGEQVFDRVVVAAISEI